MSNKSIKRIDKQAFDVDAWHKLQNFTQARIGLGRAGGSLPTNAQLKFNQDHAKARDAVHAHIDFDAINTALKQQNLSSIHLHSKAKDRTEFLQRPDFGRQLNNNSKEALLHSASSHKKGMDVAIALVDGLSSVAIQKYGCELVQQLIFEFNKLAYTSSSIMLVKQGRVAIGDEIGEIINAKSMVLIIGERPGLSAHDSLGVYYTYNPKLGLNDASRNCISNIRPQGMSIHDATEKIIWLVNQSFNKKLSGVKLKDTTETTENNRSQHSISGNFLLPK